MLIDVYALSIAAAVIGAVFTGGQNLSEEEASTADGVVGAIMIALSVLFVVVLSRTGRSPGKLLVGARLISADGRPLTFGRIFLRSFLAVMLNFFFLTYLIALGNPERTTLHDLIAKTRVVRTR